MEEWLFSYNWWCLVWWNMCCCSVSIFTFFTMESLYFSFLWISGKQPKYTIVLCLWSFSNKSKSFTDYVFLNLCSLEMWNSSFLCFLTSLFLFSKKSQWFIVNEKLGFHFNCLTRQTQKGRLNCKWLEINAKRW